MADPNAGNCLHSSAKALAATQKLSAHLLRRCSLVLPASLSQASWCCPGLMQVSLLPVGAPAEAEGAGALRAGPDGNSHESHRGRGGHRPGYPAREQAAGQRHAGQPAPVSGAPQWR